jgi:O-antigen polymerase
VLALFLTAKRWQWKVICAGIFCVGGMAMAMTYSRASWVGLAVSMAVFVFLWKPKLIPAFILLCVLAVPFLPTTVLNRILTITNTADSSTSSRVSLYKAAIEVIRRSPLTGAGLGTAATQTYIREFNLYHDKAPFVHSHNFYLEVWIQMGLLGVTGFVGSMLWNIKNAARAVRHSGPSVGRTVAAAAASAMCGAMVCGLADFLWNYPRVLVIFWFTFAMAIAGVKVCTEEAK